jgi:hypothetical protein
VDRPEVRIFLSKLGALKIIEGSERVMGTCPFARWYHSGGVDKTPSFAITVAPGGASYCRCYACNVQGPLTGIVWRLYDLVSRPDKKYFQDLMTFLGKYNLRDVFKERTPEFHELRKRLQANLVYEAQPVVAKPPEITKFNSALDESILDRFRDVPKEISDYLSGPKRRLSLRTIETWELGWHPFVNRIVIPIRDHEGNLVGLSGRATRKGDSPKYLHGPKDKFKKIRILYGLHLASSSNTHAFLAEGFFHVIWLWQNGYNNAVACMGSDVSPEQVDLLAARFKSVTLIPDLNTERSTKANMAKLSHGGRLEVNVADVSLMVRPAWVADGDLPDISDQPPKILVDILGNPNIA